MVHLFILWFFFTFSQLFISFCFFSLSPDFIVSLSPFFCPSLYSPEFPFPISLLPSCHHLFSITLLFCWLMLEIFQEFLIHSAMRTVIFAFSLVKVLSHGEDDDGASLGHSSFGWTLPWAHFASRVVRSSVECVRGSWVRGERAGWGQGMRIEKPQIPHHRNSTGGTAVQERSRMRDQLDEGGGENWKKKIHPPTPHPSFQVFLPCRCRWAAVPAPANIHLLWVVIIRKPQISIYPLFHSLSRVRGHL